MDHLGHQKYKNKQLKNKILELENIFKPVSISIDGMDELKKTNKEENIYKRHLVRLVRLVNKLDF